METGLYAHMDLSAFSVSAKMDLFGSSDASDQDILFTKWANDAIRNLDCLTNFKKHVTTLTVENKKAKLPNGFMRLIACRANNNGIIDGIDVSNMIYVDMPFIRNCDANFAGIPMVSNLAGTFEIQDGYIYIHNVPPITVMDENNQPVVEDADIKSVTIAYAGLNVDKNGLMIGYDDMERAVSAYICYKFCLQNIDIPKYAAQKTDYHEQWKASKLQKKSVDFKNDFRNTRRQIAEWANALVSDKSTWNVI